MKEAHKEMKVSYEDKQKQLGGNDGSLPTKKSSLIDAVKLKSDEEEFLSKLLPICKVNAEGYPNRKLLRANEEAPIAEAIAILNSDDSLPFSVAVMPFPLARQCGPHSAPR